MTEDFAAKLYSAEVKTLEDLADLSRDELLEKVNIKALNHTLVDAIIMAARDKVYFNDNN